MTNYAYNFKAPARINLIGEHIDYNGGVVLPCCIDLYINLYLNLRNDNNIIIKSDDFENEIKTTLDNLEYSTSFSWATYVVGVFYILKQRGYNIENGFDLYYNSEIPLGSGLSSSAAILVVTIFAINKICKLNIDKETIVLIAKDVENIYCNLSSGIMDEAIITLGKKDSALLLDCASFKYKYYDLNLLDYSFVVLKTNKSRKLVESKYNERVLECSKGLEAISKHYPIKNLCELKECDIERINKLIDDPIVLKRVKHVILENERVYKFIDALNLSNIKILGKLLNESHESLKNMYEVSGFHLDSIVEAAIKSNAIGARMTGAGFGGCAIALIKSSEFEAFKKSVIENYYAKTNIICDVYKVNIVDGVN